MMNAEHRRPFAAFVLLLAFACAVMAHGLRDQVVRVFVSSGAPQSPPDSQPDSQPESQTARCAASSRPAAARLSTSVW